MTREKHAPDRAKKRPYRAPKLVMHGNLVAVTRTKGGASSDGSGKPNTRTFWSSPS